MKTTKTNATRSDVASALRKLTLGLAAMVMADACHLLGLRAKAFSWACWASNVTR